MEGGRGRRGGGGKGRANPDPLSLALLGQTQASLLEATFRDPIPSHPMPSHPIPFHSTLSIHPIHPSTHPIIPACLARARRACRSRVFADPKPSKSKWKTCAGFGTRSSEAISSDASWRLRTQPIGTWMNLWLNKKMSLPRRTGVHGTLWQKLGMNH